MFEQYSDIFNNRGNAYHQSMCDQPRAREEEFSQLIQYSRLQPGITICDVPSGGGYLKNFIDADVSIIEIETSKAFYDLSLKNKKKNTQHIHCTDIADIPLEAGSVDRVLSLSGLHHLADRQAFYREAFRILRPGGSLCIADVAAGTGPADYLNIFVHENNSEGHEGLFISDDELPKIELAGFEVKASELIAYYWRNDSTELMIDFVQKLFGIDKCDRPTILAGIKKYLGYQEANGEVLMNWSLQFIRAYRP